MAKIEGTAAAVNVARKLFYVSFMQTTAVIEPKTPPNVVILWCKP